VTILSTVSSRNFFCLPSGGGVGLCVGGFSFGGVFWGGVRGLERFVDANPLSCVVGISVRVVDPFLLTGLPARLP